MRRFVDEHCRVGTPRPSDVPEVLDGVHGSTVAADGQARPDELGGRARDWIRSLVVADATITQLPLDLTLTPLTDDGLGQSRPIMDWLTTFHLASVVLDPYTNESSWLLRTATNVLEHFRDSDARINLVVTAGADDTRRFLGPLTSRFLVFCDPDRSVPKAMKLSELPAFVFTRVDGAVVATAEGWNPPEWAAVAEAIAEYCSWTTVGIPAADDPGSFRGSPALG